MKILVGISGGVDINDVNQAINVILEHCAEKASILDEIAAKAAMRDLLEEIGVGYEIIKVKQIVVFHSSLYCNTWNSN